MSLIAYKPTLMEHIKLYNFLLYKGIDDVFGTSFIPPSYQKMVDDFSARLLDGYFHNSPTDDDDKIIYFSSETPYFPSLIYEKESAESSFIRYMFQLHRFLIDKGIIPEAHLDGELQYISGVTQYIDDSMANDVWERTKFYNTMFVIGVLIGTYTFKK